MSVTDFDDDDSSVSPSLEPDSQSDVEPVDLTDDADALIKIFGSDDFDLSHIHDLASPDDDLDFITPSGEIADEEEQEAKGRRARRRRRALQRKRRHSLEKRDIFDGVANGAKKLIKGITDFVDTATSLVRKAIGIIDAISLIIAKLLAVPFGVPFDHTYHHDFNIAHVVKSEGATIQPPVIFEYTEGFSLADTGGIFSIQCAKCGFHSDFSVDGRLAFSIHDGITKGQISLVNSDAFNVDAIFGISLEVQYNHPIAEYSTEIAALPLFLQRTSQPRDGTRQYNDGLRLVTTRFVIDEDNYVKADVDDQANALVGLDSFSIHAFCSTVSLTSALT